MNTPQSGTLRGPREPGLVTGEQLYAEIAAAAAAAGASLRQFAAPLWRGLDSNWKLEQLRIAKRPTPPTIARVRALIAGEPLPPSRGVVDRRHMQMSRAAAEQAGIPPSRRSLNEQALLEQQAAAKARIEWLLQLSDIARDTRRPGQCLADRIRELRQEAAA